MAHLHKQPTRNWFGIAVFVFLLGLSGYGLAATSNLDSPFRVLEQAATYNKQGGDSLIRDRVGFEDVSQAGSAGAGRTRLGGLLFNLWFLLAAVALVIITQRVFGLALQQMRRARQPVMPASERAAPGLPLLKRGSR